MAYQWSGVNNLSQRSTGALTQSVCMPDFPLLSLAILQLWRSRALSRSLRADKMKRLEERSGEETLGEEKSSHVEWDESIHPFSLMSYDLLTATWQERRKSSFCGLLHSAKSRTLASSSAGQSSSLCSDLCVRHTFIKTVEAFVWLARCYQEQFKNLQLS